MSADEDASGDERVSDQAFVTAASISGTACVTLRGARDAALGGKDASVDYPARSILGVDYHLIERHHAVRRIRTRPRATRSKPT